ncbi:hypothetical protein HYC85_030081 [Camellia sinensis]|uniref:Uncharacterized protein n=1 Tax=Camellia sinensis TaxID=4442 RepID=A0A7J7FZN8_CAMSI|nr:hypothetical protein HYC85_030081 [Camellia sinensis]
MEEFLAQNLTAWIASLDGSEKLNFRGFGVNALFTLGRTPLHLPFLHAAARFWNPVTHVFSFARQEICPTFEDFRALMESGRDEELLPQLNFGHAQSLGRMCGLSMRDARSLICDGMLDIPSLANRFSGAGSGGSSVRLTEVAQGLKEGKSCIAMTLAETLMGLDAFYRYGTTRLAGSMVDGQTVGCGLLPSVFGSRPYCLAVPLVEPSGNELQYAPTCPPEGIEYPAAFPARGAQLAWQATAWRTRELLAPALTFSCTLSDECLDWLNEEAQVGPTLALEASTSSGRGRRST